MKLEIIQHKYSAKDHLQDHLSSTNYIPQTVQLIWTCAHKILQHQEKITNHTDKNHQEQPPRTNSTIL